MEPTPKSLFERHLASQSEGDFEGALAAEIEAFEALVEEHPQHAKGLAQLRDAQRNESPGSRGPLIGDHRASEGVTIGDFLLVKKLGRGGMGEVWEAEQISLSRRVALKLLPAIGSERAQEFFAREARAGGRLNHPGIVSVMGTGEDEGVRWISMELVEGGRTLRDLLKEMRSKEELPERYYPEIAELFAKIAEAMAVAHEAGVIHRDLKPANIMLTKEDEPKVADFGLARVLDEEGLSQSGEVMGTFSYMSPEQVRAVRGGLDHRTDMFSLGALMYEAMTMARPFDGDSTPQIAHKILHHDPPNPKVLRSRVPDDLAVICIKSIEKDRERRYASMDELAADLRRHLAHEPILAQPPSTWQRSAMWARRNPTKSVAGAVIAVAFMAIAGFWVRAEGQRERAEEAEKKTASALVLVHEEKEATSAALEVAETERGLAEKRAAELQQVSDFQARQLAGVNAEAMGMTLRAMVLERARAAGERTGREPEALDEERAALERLLAGTDFTGLALGVLDEHVFERVLQELEVLENQPLVQAQLLNTLAGTMRELGLLARALEPQERALRIRRRELGDDHPDTVLSTASLGTLLAVQGKFDEAEPLMREALEVRRDALGDDHPDTLFSVYNLGALFSTQGKPDEAEPFFREALEGRRRALGDDHPETLQAIRGLGGNFRVQGRLDEAEPLLLEALEGRRRTLGDDHPDTLFSIQSLASLYWSRGKTDEAEPLFREALEGLRLSRGDDHPDTLFLIDALGRLLWGEDKTDEAELLFREELEGYRRTMGDDHVNTIEARNMLGNLYYRQSRYEEAEPFYREALEAFRRTLGNEHPRTHDLIHNLSGLFYSHGKLDEAEALATELLSLAKEGDPKYAQIETLLNRILSRKMTELNERAWGLVDPDRINKETDVAEGLRLARMAVEAGPHLSAFRDTLAWALYANGLPDEALSESRRALELVGEQQKEEYQGYLDHLQARIDGAGEGEDG